jgi:hypothetical protein
MQSVEQDTAFLMQVGMHVCVCVCVCVCERVGYPLCVLYVCACIGPLSCEPGCCTEAGCRTIYGVPHAGQMCTSMTCSYVL